MDVLPATDADIPALAALHARGFDEPWTEEALRELGAGPGVFILKAEADKKISGMVMARMVSDEAEILTITVEPAARGQKIAARLMEDVMVRAIAAGVTSLFLEVAEDNEAALALYARLGFHEVGRRPAYYSRPSGPVGGLIMARPLR